MIGVLALFGAELAATLAATDGHFTYSLDDPYIHLTLSEQIRQGHYGFNAGEASTPSSSVAWPVLLALTAGTRLHVWTPLLVGVAATITSVLLIVRAVRTAFPAAREWTVASVGLLVVVCLNLIGVVFTGLEHPVHITISLAVGLGLVERSRGRALPWWTLLGLTIGPWLRYEGLAVSLAAGLVLFAWGERRRVAVALTAAVAPLVLFSAWAVSAGLDPLPSSVEFKSGVVRGGSRFTELAHAWHGAVTYPLFVLALLTVLVHIAVRRRIDGLDGFALIVLIAHASVGQFGGFWRYELYAYVAVAPMVLVRLRDLLNRSHWPWPRVASVLALVVCLAGSTQYVLALVDSSRASRNIWLQQAQMARFVAEDWDGPVAVNDIGLVGYRSHHYVLDLWGLANQEAGKKHSAGQYDYMAPLSAQHHVRLVMLYDRWFPKIPDSWVRVGQLTFDGPRVSAFDRVVSIYATDADDVAEIRQRFETFAESLPKGAHFTPSTRV